MKLTLLGLSFTLLMSSSVTGGSSLPVLASLLDLLLVNTLRKDIGACGGGIGGGGGGGGGGGAAAVSTTRGGNVCDTCKSSCCFLISANNF